MDMQSCSTSKYGSLTDVTRISIKELYLNFLFSMFCNTGVKKILSCDMKHDCIIMFPLHLDWFLTFAYLFQKHLNPPINNN